MCHLHVSDRPALIHASTIQLPPAAAPHAASPSAHRVLFAGAPVRLVVLKISKAVFRKLGGAQLRRCLEANKMGACPGRQRKQTAKKWQRGTGAHGKNTCGVGMTQVGNAYKVWL